MPLNVLAFGASQNIGYFATLSLLSQGHNVVYLLRRKDTFDEDAKMREYIKSGRAKLVFGDASSKDDIKKAWDIAAENGPVDYVIFTVGGKPVFSVTRGFYLQKPLHVADCMHALLSVWPHPEGETTSPTKLIVVTSNGLTKESHAALPGPSKLLYNVLLPAVHKDKRVVEEYIAYCAANSASYHCTEKEVAELTKSGHLTSDWKNGLVGGDWLDVVIIRPSLLFDGEGKVERKGFESIRISDDVLPSAWGIARKDVGWFIVNKVVTEWDSWKGKALSISN